MEYLRLYIRKVRLGYVRFTMSLLVDKFHPPTSSLGWGGGIKYFNKGAIRPKITLACNLHIKLGHRKNKYGENVV